MKASPIFYMGNKRKICMELISYFPKNIDTFYELFGGSGVISMNTKANTFILNDISPEVYKLYSLFKNISHKEIINHIENRIIEFDLPTPKDKNKWKDKKKITRI
jgi:DNA adenine methylase